MKAMLSQPEEEIVATREKAIKALETQGYELVDTYFNDEWSQKENMEAEGVVQIPVRFLAKATVKKAFRWRYLDDRAI